MSPDKQRIAIATACGWAEVRPYPMPLPPGSCESSPAIIAGIHESYDYVHSVPDYPSDLNAMHEAEKVLMNEQWDRYEADLWQIVAPTAVIQASTPIRFRRAFLSATAAQRAEAFLKTLGRWEGEA